MISFPLVYKNLEVTLLNDTKQGLLDYELQQFFKTSKFYLNQNMTFIRDGKFNLINFIRGNNFEKNIAKLERH